MFCSHCGATELLRSLTTCVRCSQQFCLDCGKLYPHFNVCFICEKELKIPRTDEDSDASMEECDGDISRAGGGVGEAGGALADMGAAM